MQVRDTSEALTATTVAALNTETAPVALSDFAGEINRIIRPPRAVSGEEIQVRAALVVSDQRNHYGGKFAIEELRRLRELVIDTPVLVGHRKDRLPIGRVFRAELVNKADVHWLKVYFYWLSETEGAETLGANIDGGVYKECSLGFTFARAECSVCGADIRTCGHSSEIATVDTLTDSQTVAAWYYYREIKRALEISLVYRGANPDTRVGAELGFVELSKTELSSDSRTSFEGLLSQLTVTRQRYVGVNGGDVPVDDSRGTKLGASGALEGLPLFVGRRRGELFVKRDDFSEAQPELCECVSMIFAGQTTDFLLYGRLIGMRGKQRRSVSELAQRLQRNRGPVRTYRFRALALLSAEELTLDEIIELSSAVTRAPAVGSQDNAPEKESVWLSDFGKCTIIRSASTNQFIATVRGENALTFSVDGADINTIWPSQSPARDSAGVGESVLIQCDRIVEHTGVTHATNVRIVERFGVYTTAEDEAITGNAEASVHSLDSKVSQRKTVAIRASRSFIPTLSIGQAAAQERGLIIRYQGEDVLGALTIVEAQ